MSILVTVMFISINSIGYARMVTVGPDKVGGGTSIHLNDDIAFTAGNTAAAPNFRMLWETADANANAMFFITPEGGAVDIPIFYFGDASIFEADLGLFTGSTDPTVAVMDDAGANAVFMRHDGTNGILSAFGNLQLTSSNSLVFIPDQIDLCVGTGADWCFMYDEATSDSMVLREGTVDTLFIKGSDPGAQAAANETAGNDIYFRSQNGGEDSSLDGAHAGSDIFFESGTGGAAGLTSGATGGAGGNFTITTGGGGNGNEGAPSGAGGVINLVGDTKMQGSRFHFSKASDEASTASGDLDIDGISNGNYIDITGILDINTINSEKWQAGSIIILQFDGNAGTNGVRHAQAGAYTTIRLAGAADFAYTTDDVLVLIFDGFSWREISRTVI